MGFRFNRRVGGNKGWGLNIGSGGFSSSYRSKRGSIGTKGFSVKTGIPGLSFRNTWGSGGKNKGATALIFLAFMAAFALLYISILVLYNVATFIVWASVEIYHFGLRVYYDWKEKQGLQSNESQQLP